MKALLDPARTGIRGVEALMEYVTRAPSGDNTQPWRFVYDEEHREMSIEMEHARVDTPRSLWEFVARMSCGAALENLLQAAPSFGFKPILLPLRKDALARVRLDPDTANRVNHGVLERIATRTTNRKVYDRKSVCPAVREALRDSTPNLGSVESFWITERERVDGLADLICEIDETQYGIYSLWKPIEMRVRFDRPALEPVQEGLSLGSLELSYLKQVVLRSVRGLPHDLLRKLGIVKAFSQRSRELIQSASGLLLIVAGDDHPDTDVQVGRSLQRGWLALTEAGLYAHPMNSPALMEAVLDKADAAVRAAAESTSIRTHLKDFRTQLPEMAGRRCAFVLRFGYTSPPSGRSGRLPVHKVVSVR